MAFVACMRVQLYARVKHENRWRNRREYDYYEKYRWSKLVPPIRPKEWEGREISHKCGGRGKETKEKEKNEEKESREREK